MPVPAANHRPALRLAARFYRLSRIRGPLAAGADGVISVVANAFPERFSQMVHASMASDLTLAKAAHYDLFNVTKMFFEEGNPGGVKVALAARGLMQETMRLPLYPVSEGLRTRIQAETTRLLASL